MNKVRIATDLIIKINAALEEDQGSAWRKNMKALQPLMQDAFKDDDGLRLHLGASQIGNECARHIWLNFRWFSKDNFDARILRLFNRGHAEEPRLIALLQMIGAEVKFADRTGRQFKISDCGGHFGGSVDAVARNIVPDKPNMTVLVEFKTHGNASFVKMVGKLTEYRAHLKDPARHPFKGRGMYVAKPEHFTQMQIYMSKLGIKMGLYVAVNKDTDDIYLEFINPRPSIASFAIEHAQSIIDTPIPPDRICRDETFFKAKLCPNCDVCFSQIEPLKNCRTCAKVIPAENGTWVCGGRSGRTVLTKSDQEKACSAYRGIAL